MNTKKLWRIDNIVKSLLLVGNENSIYIKRIVKELSPYFQIGVFDITEFIQPITKEYSNLIIRKLVIYLSVLKELKQLSTKYSDCHIHFVATVYGYYIPFMRLFFKNIYTSVWGSDLYRVEKGIFLQRVVFALSNKIHIPHNRMKEHFVEKFGDSFDKKISIFPFGMNQDSKESNSSQIERFCREWHIDILKKVIVIGYNGRKEQQHIPAIKSILELDQSIKKQIQIVLQLGENVDKEYFATLESFAKGDELNLVLIDKYLTDYDVKLLRQITDIFINVQTTDALASSVLEYLLNNTLVINGEWLEYEDLYKAGVRCEKVESPIVLHKILPNLIKSEYVKSEDYKTNAIIVEKLYTWNFIINSWLTFLENNSSGCRR